ncbi:hypothetical protein BLSTO_05903 [Blastocystis sp. subtype 1]
MLYFSGVLRRCATKLSQVCNDLRLLASGPRCGLHEIMLPPRAPGSSIMPGKVNPVIPEVVNQTCFQIIGGDLTCGLASEAGQLELNVMEPVLIYNCFNNINMFTRATKTLRTLCVDGIVADKAQCKKLLDNSIGVVTDCRSSIKDVLVELGYCTKQEVEDLLVPEKMTKPNYITHKN